MRFAQAEKAQDVLIDDEVIRRTGLPPFDGEQPQAKRRDQQQAGPGVAQGLSQPFPVRRRHRVIGQQNQPEQCDGQGPLDECRQPQQCHPQPPMPRTVLTKGCHRTKAGAGEQERQQQIRHGHARHDIHAQTGHQDKGRRKTITPNPQHHRITRQRQHQRQPGAGGDKTGRPLAGSKGQTGGCQQPDQQWRLFQVGKVIQRRNRPLPGEHHFARRFDIQRLIAVDDAVPAHT